MTNKKIRYFDSRFLPLYVERLSMYGVGETILCMKDILNTTVVDFNLVHESYVSPYIKLLDALEKLTEALFELCPNGIVRFELTEKKGITMLFKTKQSHEGRIFSVISVGWVYASGVSETIENELCVGTAILQQVSLCTSR